MNSTTSMIAEEYRIQQWATDIQACQMRPKDISVAAWCHEHGITKANYYYRLRRVREACLDGVEQTNPAPVFAQLPTGSAVGNLMEPDAIIRFGDCSIEIRNSISADLLEKLLQLIHHA
ncbi:IS66 family insertion sequence element accessory protein TnpB [Lacrimispora sp. BS-2]|uniref:IS66 family insertion sequence element accessory protein TnpB n=1 Tax=Lacrimispora sp. BS-2 TaxID=3151850 RepID=A0AAU7PUN8_9FIRM